MKTKTVEYLEPERREKITHSVNSVTLTLDIGHKDLFKGNLKSNADNKFEGKYNNMLYDYSSIDWSNYLCGILWKKIEDNFTSAMNNTFASSNAESFTNTTVVIADGSINDDSFKVMDIENLFMTAVPKVLRNL